MRLLFDTHAFLWWMEQDTAKLSPRIFDAIKDQNNAVFVSVINAWEIVIKSAQGKLDTPRDLAGAIEYYGFTWLDVSLSHVLEVRALPNHHKDPFDRMLVAQSRVEGLTLITTDPHIRRYEVPVLDQ